jgi:hypothetical protein
VIPRPRVERAALEGRRGARAEPRGASTDFFSPPAERLASRGSEENIKLF